MDVDNSDLDMIMCQFRTMNTNDKDHLISEFKRLSNTQLSTEGCCFYLDLAEWNLNSALWAYYEYEAAAAAANYNNNNNTNNNQIALINNNNNTTNTITNNGYSSPNLSQSSSNSSLTNSSYFNELPEMQFLCDITIGEGESVAPNTNFIKTWRIKNTGNKRWPPGCQLKYVNGYNFSPATLTSSLTSSATISTTLAPVSNLIFSSNDHSSSVSPSSSSSTSASISSSLSSSSSPSSPCPPVAIDLKELEPQEITDISISLKSPIQCGIYQCQYRTYTKLNQPFGDPIWLLLNVEEGGLLGCIQQLNSVNMFGKRDNEFSNHNSNIFSKSTVNGHINSNNNNYFDQTNQVNQNGDLNHFNTSNNYNQQLNLNKPTVFKLDSNLNLVQNETTTNHSNHINQTRYSLNGGATSANDASHYYNEEEKRPDFYDDMFS